MNRLARAVSGTFATAAAVLCFGAAAVVDREPAVPKAPIPEAADVRATIEFAQMADALVSVSEPFTFQLPQRWLTGVHRLVSHAKSNLGMDGRIDRTGATFRVSKRLMRHGWLNLAFRLDQSSDARAPTLSLYAGGWRSPDRLTALLVRFALPLLAGDRATLEDLVPRFRVEGDAVQMTARIPKNLIGGVQAVLSPGPGTAVDMALARSFYGDLLQYVLLHPNSDYAQVVRHVAVKARGQQDLKAMVVALTMLVDGLRVRRLGGERTTTAPCSLEPQVVRLHGREDLPKHWTISAALALFMNQKTARAAGLWKELDDSLEGGSGFSLVDLSADMGGIAVGMAARDGKGLNASLSALRMGKADIILPPDVLHQPEGLALAMFERRYGGLEQPRMLEAESRIGAILRQSPLYRPLLANLP